MPEGPELFITSRFINEICKNIIFSGKILKSEVSTRNPDINWHETRYTISATSRGKELKLTLCSCPANDSIEDNKQKCTMLSKTMDIVFHFGMSGKFRFDAVQEKQKHAHLNFYTEDQSRVLSFVDYRRFGRWFVTDNWGQERGPCVLREYEQFR